MMEKHEGFCDHMTRLSPTLMKARFRALLSSTTVPNALLSTAIICAVIVGVRRHRLGRAVLALPPALCLGAAAYHYVADLSAELDMCTAWKKISRLAKIKQVGKQLIHTTAPT